jgi:glycosyltransferase involved in cell wall biosynthesis
MTARRRVMYFTICSIPDGIQENGGNLYARNNILRLHQDAGIDLHVLVLNQESGRESTEAYFRKLGIPHQFIAFRTSSIPAVRPRGLLNRLRYRCNFPGERESDQQPHVSALAEQALHSWSIDYVLVDYLYAVPYWKNLLKLSIEKAIITPNREAEMYGELLRLGKTGHGPVRGWIAHRRFERFEKSVYRAFSKVITIGRPDIPGYLDDRKTACITPFLDPAATQWKISDSRNVFFVGALEHYPNQLAIEYISRQLAPHVSKRMPDARFQIIGASSDEVPADWRHSSVQFLGRADRAQVQRLYTGCRLFICPVKNNYGMKFKVAEALSYGTPFLASPETMLCVPYLTGQPVVPLDDPQTAANEVCRLLKSDDALQQLQQTISEKHCRFTSSQKNVWSRTLFGNSAEL